jgi:beta,beta-carotene 9',10'-dioxygenase
MMLPALTAAAFLAPHSRSLPAMMARISSPVLSATGAVGDSSAQAEADLAASFAAWWEDADDEVSDRVCSITGSLPEWLRGRLIRNGPGKWMAGDGARCYQHAFDGLAKLVCFDVSDNGVRFSTRFLRTDWYDKMSTGAMPPSVTTGPVDPPWSSAEGLVAAVTGTAFDNTPVNLHRLGGGDRWVAVTDAPPLIEFDPKTLETIGRVEGRATPFVGQTKKLGFSVPGTELFSTAHPQRHPKTGETLNYHLELRPAGGPVAHIVATSASGAPGSPIDRRILGSVELETIGISGIPYVHSFGVTDDYIVLMLYPLTIPFDKLVNGRGFLPQLKWDESAGSKLVVWDMRLGPSRAPSTWKAPSCWAYHVINAYNEGGIITIDLNAYTSPEIATGDHGFAYLPNMQGDADVRAKQEREGGYLRLQVNDFGDPTPTRKAKAQWLDMVDAGCRDWTFELARINEGRSGKRHRFAYGFTGFAHQQPEGEPNTFGPGGAVVKMDAEANGGGEPPPSTKPRLRTSSGLRGAPPPEDCPVNPSVLAWSSPNVFPSEPVFVPRPGATEEDDGVLLFLGYDLLRRESFMGVLSANDMAEMARVYCGSRCCVSFHGHWVPAS